ncbi:MAG TPA: DNA polymerase III subunit delta' [Gammaproteobacteria bacterium]|nr:DNA polymerase III subunit delta' [Gammaproteobacteria bacterium]
MIYPWQQKQWQHMQLQLQNHKLPHALLLAGPEGLGKRAFAEAFAAYLLCDNRQETACGVCRHCQLFNAHTHPDWLELSPAAEGKIIKVEQIRELVAELAQTAQQASYQVIMINPAEAMNSAAANALLKNLEEPQGLVVFLLISHQPSAIPATILSRCQRINFTAPDIALSRSWLQQQLPPHQNAEVLLKLAENMPLRALSFAENGWVAVYDKILQQLMQLSLGVGDPLFLAANCQDEDFARIYSIMWTVLFDLICAKSMRHGQSANELTKISDRTTFSALFTLLDKLMEMKKLLENKINLNMQLAYEKLFIEWSQIFN